MINRTIPDVNLKTRVRDESVGGPNPFRWQDFEVREVGGAAYAPRSSSMPSWASASNTQVGAPGSAIATGACSVPSS